MINKFVQDIKDFHEKFKLNYKGGTRTLDAEEFAFRIKVHFEESQEYEDAVKEQNLEKQLDSLVDLVYFALGTAYRQGLPFEKAWDRVHAANMAKRMANDANESLRGFKRDIVKPEGWVAPDLSDLLGKAPVEYRPQLFIVEGPDACGKTTFAKELAHNLGGVYWHMTATKELAGLAQIDYQMNSIENVRDCLARGRHVVLDRSWPSEFCYGRILRGVEWESIEPLKTAMEFLSPYFIYCMDKDAEAASERHKLMLDDAHPYNEEQYKAVYASYIDFIMDGEKSGAGGMDLTVRLFNDKPDWQTTMAAEIADIRRVVGV